MNGPLKWPLSNNIILIHSFAIFVRLVSIALAINAGNLANLSENEMKLLILQKNYNCEMEKPHCPFSCDVLISSVNAYLNTY